MRIASLLKRPLCFGGMAGTAEGDAVEVLGRLLRLKFRRWKSDDACVESSNINSESVTQPASSKGPSAFERSMMHEKVGSTGYVNGTVGSLDGCINEKVDTLDRCV